MDLSAIVSCNNEGVTFMLHDDQDRAMECFKSGIAMIRSKLNDEEQAPQQCQDLTACAKENLQGQKIVESISFHQDSPGIDDMNMNHTKSSPPTHDASTDMDITEAHSTVINDKNDGFLSFFHRALVVPESAIAEICEMSDPFSLLFGYYSSADQSFRLAKALSLYGVVGSILERSQDQTSSTKFGLLVYLASYNNMAHIYSEMCAFQELRNTWRSLFDVCVAYHHVIDSDLNPEEQDLFLLNAFLFTDGANVAPAA